MLKNIVRRSSAGLLLILLSPLLIAIAIAIKLSSRGPVLFLQNRTGLHGKLFKIIKFRTFVNATDPNKPHDENNINKLGRFLRKVSIDELPQILNIIRGEMTFVGPRPHAVEVDNNFCSQIPNLKQRYKVLPGITGLAQIKGLRGYISNPEIMRLRIKLDLIYIRKKSIILDLKIALVTVFGGFWFQQKH